jgi:HEAT repeat protein
MFRKAGHLFLILIVLSIVSCGDNRYVDEQLQMEIQQLDSDLENRWSTTGVVVISPGRASLQPGELISYVIGEYPINSGSDYKQAVKKSMKDDNNFRLLMADGRDIRLAVRRRGDQIGIDVKGNRVSKVKNGSPGYNANIKVGDLIKSVIDERKIKKIKDYKKAVKEFKSKVAFRTTELVGVKLAAVEALGNLGDARAVDALVNLLEESSETSLRKTAAKGLERLVALSQLNDLFQKFQQANVNELPADQLDARKRESAEILGLLTVDLEQNLATLKDPFGTQFRHRSEALHQKVNEANLIELSIKYMKREVEPDQEIRRACLSILGALKPLSAIEVLVDVMEDGLEVPGIRFQAGLTLSQIGKPAIKPLIEAFDRGDVGVKDIAASALGNIGGDQVRDALIAALKTVDEPTIRLTLVDAIAKIGDERSIKALREEKNRLQGGSGLGTFLNELLAQFDGKSM